MAIFYRRISPDRHHGQLDPLLGHKCKGFPKRLLKVERSNLAMGTITPSNALLADAKAAIATATYIVGIPGKQENAFPKTFSRPIPATCSADTSHHQKPYQTSFLRA
jgi:hypothetical protein